MPTFDELKKLQKDLEKDYPEDPISKIKKEKEEVVEKRRFLQLTEILKSVSDNVIQKMTTIFSKGAVVSNFPDIQKIQDIENEKKVVVLNFEELSEKEIETLKKILPLETVVTNVIDTNINNIPESIKISNFPITNEIIGDVKILNFPESQKVWGEIDIKFPETQKVSGEIKAKVDFPDVQEVIIQNWPLTQNVKGEIQVKFPDVQKVDVVNQQIIEFPEVQKIEGKVETDVKFPDIQKVEIINQEKQKDKVEISNFPKIQKVEFDKTLSIKTEKQIPENYIPVRLSDGKKWLEQMSEIVAVSSQAFSDSSGIQQRGLVDVDRHLQVDILTSSLPVDASTETKQDVLIAKDFATQTTLSLIKTKTDNLDTPLSGIKTQTDKFTFTGDKLKVDAVIETGDIEIGAVEIKNAADDTRAVVDSDGLSVSVKKSVLPVDAATQTTLALIKTKTDNLDTALSGIKTGTDKIISAPATEAKQLPDGHEVEVNNFPAEYPLPTGQITTLTPPAAITGFATSAKQLVDGHNVNVSNMIPAVETGLATSAKQLANNHQVTANLSTTDNQVLDDISTNTAKIPTNPVSESTSITEYNITCTSADIEYSQVLPANTKQIQFQCRGSYDIRYAYTTGKVAGSTAPYFTLKAGMSIHEDKLNLTSKTLYVACSTAGQVVELTILT